ncbi:MAG: hypothetical protein U5K37_12485 [Natrialbaceae archaeon]|nr:hypothetical protein [Natrialbaceae archaeon]
MVSVETVDNPADLSDVGVKVSSFCEQWGSDHVELVVCIHSLEHLIDATSQQTTFEFIRLLNERLRSADATAHVHLNPSVTDGPTLETFEPLFDEVEVAGLGAAPPSEREESSAPRFGRSTATDSDIARNFDDDGAEAVGPKTPDRPASDSEIADRLGDDEPAPSAAPVQPDAPASDDEIASRLGADDDEAAELGQAPESPASDDEIAERLEGAADPTDMDPDELLEVEVDDSDVSDDEIEDQLEEWRD